MSASSPPGPQPRGPIRERDIKGLKYFGAISDLLRSLRGHKDCPNRELHYDQLAALVLLHFFNPVLTGLRSLQSASRRTQRSGEVGCQARQPRQPRGSLARVRPAIAARRGGLVIRQPADGRAASRPISRRR